MSITRTNRERLATLRRRCDWINKQLAIPNLNEGSKHRFRAELSALIWAMDIVIEKYPELLNPPRA